MDTQFQVEVLRLHCEHIRTLIDRVIIKLTAIERALTTKEDPSSALVEPYLNGLEKQSKYIAAEAVRLQGFLHSFGPQSRDASDAAGESPDVKTLKQEQRIPLHERRCL